MRSEQEQTVGSILGLQEALGWTEGQQGIVPTRKKMQILMESRFNLLTFRADVVECTYRE